MNGATIAEAGDLLERARRGGLGSSGPVDMESAEEGGRCSGVPAAARVFPFTWSSMVGEVGPVDGRRFNENLESFMERRERERGGLAVVSVVSSAMFSSPAWASFS